MSGDADRGRLPAEWQRLEARAGDAIAALAQWTARARQAEEELQRLRDSVEDLAAARAEPGDPVGELRRLRAENAALRSRMTQAQRRLSALMQRLGALEDDR